MEKYHMVKPGSHVLVGLSGGADSVCLFFLLHKLAEEMNFRLSAVHVNHMLRGESADSDSRFAEELSKRLNRDFYSVRVPVKEISEREKISLEEAGRKARYQVFYKTAEHIGADVIALAHHKNDQSETMLFHLARGCGISGLRGMKPVRIASKDRTIIRPLLCVTRNEIEDYLKENRIEFVTDETNGENLFSRNKIRNQILPLMEQQLCEQMVEHMAQTAQLLGEAEDFLLEATEAAYGRILLKTDVNQYILSIEELEKVHSYLKGAVIKKALERIADESKDLERIHVEQVLALSGMEVGKRVSLPYGITARKGYNSIFLEKEESGFRQIQKGEDISFHLPKPGERLEIPIGKDSLLLAEVMTYQEFLIANCEGKKGEVPNKPYTKWFDCDKIRGCLTIRFRNPGDYFYLNEKDKKKLKAFFIHEKIPREERDSIYVISEESHVLWITGYRISHYYKITENTSHVLEITIRGGLTHGRENQSTDF